MAITDLTGTTWRFKDIISASPLGATENYALEITGEIRSDGYHITLPYTYNGYTYDKVAISGSFYSSSAQGGNSAVFQFGVYGYGASSSGEYISYYNAGVAEVTETGWRYWNYSYSPSVPRKTAPIITAPLLTINGGEGATDAKLIAWLEENATLVVPSTTITYDGETAEMKNGQTATFKCAGKKMTTDIVITPEFSVEIVYGDIINTADKGQTATLKCAGKKMKHDVVISTSLTVCGTWLLNPTVDFSMLEGNLIQEINGQMVNTYNYPFDKIRIKPSSGTIEVYVTSSGYLTYKPVYSNGWIWNDTAIKFGDEPQAVTIDFYNWLTANATMQ